MKDLPEYWRSRWLFERGLALIYLVAFLAAAEQFVPLAGEHGLLPAPLFVREVPFRFAPSLFYWSPTDTAFRLGAWLGVLLSALGLSGLPARAGAVAGGAVWALLYVLYLSFINVGQTFYAFGWESLLVEMGFFAIFAGGRTVAPMAALNWIYRWTLFRLMFGAGLIKWRGDTCWRDLTCLDVFFETQPMPNPLSWYFHQLPRTILHSGVVINHIVELAVPFAFVLPQPYAGVAGLITILFQLMLVLGGNLSWLNWLTIVLALTAMDDRFFRWLPVRVPPLRRPGTARRIVVAVLAGIVILLSVGPVLNLLSSGQLMNTAYNPLQIVNSYGAFGSITKERDEIVIEGSAVDDTGDPAVWRAYEFKGKPGDPARLPPQVAPYHLRLDWLMWFAAMSTPTEHPWFQVLLLKLLQGDQATLGLLRANPFPNEPPRWVRAQLYRYRFTTPAERAATGEWWKRELVAPYFPAVRRGPRTGAQNP